MGPSSIASPPPLWPADRRYGVPAGVLALAVLALGLLLGSYHELGGYGVENDFYAYFWPGAQDLLAGQPMLNPRAGPGFSVLLAGASFVCGDLFLFGKLLAATSVAAAGWFTFLLVRSFVRADVALLAQAFTYAIVFRYSVVVCNDLLVVALGTASLYWLLRRQQPTLGDAALAGLLAGIACGIRYPSVALFATAAFALWVAPPPATTLRQRLWASLAYALPALAGSVPAWAAQELGLSGKKESKSYAFVALDIYAAPTDRLSPTHLEEMETRFSSMWDVFTRDPRRVLQHYSTDIHDDAVRVLTDSVTLPAGLFVGAGLLLWLLAGMADRRRGAALLVCALLHFGILVLVPYQARYGYPLVPTIAALVASALCYRFPGGGTTLWHRWLPRALVVLTLLPPIAMSVLKTREYLTTEPVELLAARDVVRALAKPGDRMIARKNHLPQISGLGFVFPRTNVDLDAFLAWARDDVQARFLLVGDQEVLANGKLAALRDDRVAPPGLRLIWQHEAPRQRLFELTR